MNTKLYTDFYQDYYQKIQSWVTKAGVPLQEVPDVTSSIVLTILEKDGIGKYDPTKNAKVSTYLNKYVFLSVRSYREDILRPKHFSQSLYAEVPEPQGSQPSFWNAVPTYDNSKEEDFELFDRLYDTLEGDSLEFLMHAYESENYTQARKCLSDKGWEKSRITAAVIAVRKATKEFLSE